MTIHDTGPVDLYSMTPEGEYVHIGTVSEWKMTYVNGSWRLAPPKEGEVTGGEDPAGTPGT